MRPDDFIIPTIVDGWTSRGLDDQRVEALRRGPLPDVSDIEAVTALATFTHRQYEAHGTDGATQVDEDESRLLLLALKATLKRLGIDFAPPFRDFSTFYGYWIRKGASGSWQARRNLLEELFEPLHRQLLDLEDRHVTATLADAISPRSKLGWQRVDTEIAALRQHFAGARSAQDYRNVGNDCVAVTEALSAQTYDAKVHLRDGEDEPRVDQTKSRLDRVVEDALPGKENAEIRKLARATIELAQKTKHSPTTSRRAAGIAADAVILLANMLRRLEDD